MAILNFNASAVAPVTMDSQYVPTNWYGLKVVESELKPTKKADGTILAITLEVMNGKYAGHRINESFNVQNPNEKAQRIGQGLLSMLCHATGQLNLVDSRQLHGVAFYGKLRLDAPEAGYQPRNTLINAKSTAETMELTDLELPVFEAVKVPDTTASAFTPGASAAPSFPGSAGMPAFSASAAAPAPTFPGAPVEQPAPTFPGVSQPAAPAQAPQSFPASAPAQQAVAPAFPAATGAPGATPPWAK